jgi:hypothetical protein
MGRLYNTNIPFDMKKSRITTIISLLVSLCLGKMGSAQSINDTAIDTSNYYNYFSYGKNLQGTRLTTSWLELSDVAPVIEEEMKNAGYMWVTDINLYKVDSAEYIILAAYSRKSNVGFLYVEGHPMFPDKKDRKAVKRDSVYRSCVENSNGKADFVKIDSLPIGIFKLYEACYWYQRTENPDDDKNLITKEIAINILRQDVRAYLSTLPKPTK